MTISGQYVDLYNKTIFPAEVTISAGIITDVTRTATADACYILPGFTDAHIHIESAMLVPTAFARMAVVHGTVATVSDPHEIANVCGMDGVQYMIDNSKLSPFKFFFGAPSCVPATGFETAGATIDAAGVAALLASPDIWYLSEMMNYPGVLHNAPEVIAKIQAAHLVGKPVDGHAPGLRGDVARAYAAAGISTDHECFTLDEALDKIAAGMHIIIREGSAARNFEALAPLLALHPGSVMFCSDDKHPDELLVSHINALVKRALSKGYDLYDVLRAACINPIAHYKLPVGTLRVGDPADFIIAVNLSDLTILPTRIAGVCVARNGTSLLPDVPVTTINNFNTNPKVVGEFAVAAPAGECMIRVIATHEGQLITSELILPATIGDGNIVADTQRDILKIAVVNRYQPHTAVAVGFIRNFGLQSGALASTVAHDCHNIIAVGADDESLCAAVNALIACQGGIAVAQNDHDVHTMALPVAGLMSDKGGAEVAAGYTRIDALAKGLGTPLHAPFMTLSFMALLVIPALKLSDKGLFDGNSFVFAPIVVQ